MLKAFEQMSNLWPSSHRSSQSTWIAGKSYCASTSFCHCVALLMCLVMRYGWERTTRFLHNSEVSCQGRLEQVSLWFLHGDKFVSGCLVFVNQTHFCYWISSAGILLMQPVFDKTLPEHHPWSILHTVWVCVCVCVCVRERERERKRERAWPYIDLKGVCGGGGGGRGGGLKIGFLWLQTSLWHHCKQISHKRHNTNRHYYDHIHFTPWLLHMQTLSLYDGCCHNNKIAFIFTDCIWKVLQ